MRAAVFPSLPPCKCQAVSLQPLYLTKLSNAVCRAAIGTVLCLVSATDSGDSRNLLMLGQGLLGISSFRASLCPACGSLAALRAALLMHINPGHPWQSVHLLRQWQLSVPAIHHLELRLEVSCERWVYLHHRIWHVVLLWAVIWLPGNNLQHCWPEHGSVCYLQTALKIKGTIIS